ncbi:DUF421 domain-containing protein [Bacillus sp. RO2]|uniref:DUF421 domain-containing protein n=1 Tax=Bacillus sp. RO2 TaxID=2723913 RepID=UPI00145D327C|nr:DUF421 domain-containing protein [Bacillus sp. RO2]NMH74543.1 DUF421 domain-containing protein [Bacillus sp. RO2]
MDLNWIWKAVLITIIGTFLLRIAGRKSISQMTLAQVVIMIGIGSLLIQPLAGKSIWVTFGVGITLVITLVLMEFLQLKSDIFEKLITGKSKILIENGKLNEDTLKKLRFTIDQLEMKLRQNSISSISDVKWATLEPNGQLGFELNEQAKPVTKKEWNILFQEMQLLKIMMDPTCKPSRVTNELEGNLFTEVKNGKHKLKERPDETLD